MTTSTSTVSPAEAMLAANAPKATTTHLFYHDALVFKCRWTYWAWTVVFILMVMSVFLSWVGIGGLALLTWRYVDTNRQRNGKIALYNQLYHAHMASGAMNGPAN